MSFNLFLLLHLWAIVKWSSCYSSRLKYAGNNYVFNNNNNNNNNKHFFNLQVANSPSRLRFEANLSRESSECTEHSQDQTSQINTVKTVYVGNA